MWMSADLREVRGVKAACQFLFYLMVGVNVDGIVGGGHGGGGVFAEIETGHGDGFCGLPMADAEFAVFALVDFVAGGDEAEFSGPAHGEVVDGEIGGIAEMGIPAFAGVDEEYAVSGVVDDAAAVVDAQGKIGAGAGEFGKHDVQVIVAAEAALLRGHALILEELERVAIFRGDAVNIEGAGKIESEQAVAGVFCVDGDRGGGVERVVGEYGSVDGIARSMKINRRRRQYRADCKRPRHRSWWRLRRNGLGRAGRIRSAGNRTGHRMGRWPCRRGWRKRTGAVWRAGFRT